MLKLMNRNLKLVISLIVLSLGILVTNPTQTVIQNKLPEIKLAKVDLKQLSCLAKNIFFEARGEPIHGQAAVARVVMNRIAHGFGSNPCSVIYQKTTVADKVICQFSWACAGNSEPNKNNSQYKVAKQIAFEVMVMGMHKDIVPKSTLFFHSINVDPSWPYKKVKTIGSHIFYSNKKIKH